MIKHTALTLVGAEYEQFINLPDKNGRRKAGTKVVLPDRMEAGQSLRYSEDGVRLHNPNWGAMPNHKENREYIRAVAAEVYQTTVSSL